MTPDRRDELIALAALGELSPTDEVELDAAVRDDPALAAEVDDALTSAAALQRVHAESPPPRLRASVLAAVASTPQDDVGDDADTSTPVPPAIVPDSAAPASMAPPVSIDTARERRRWVSMLAAAAAVIVFVVGAAVLVANDDVDAPDQYAAILDAPDAESHSLGGDISGSLTVTFSASNDAMVVRGEDLPVLSDEATYQLWIDIDGHMTPAGLFRPDEDGNVEARIDGIETTGSSINVTEEPAGGSEEPTLPVLATTA